MGNTGTQDTGTSVAKGSLVLNVKDYGAKGDYDPVAQTGTDDTTAIQNCVNDALLIGADVYVPAAYYKITAAITVPGSVTVFGAGCYGLFGSQAAQGFNSINAPMIEPFLFGSVLVQCTAATDGVVITATGKTAHLRGLGVLFDKTIRYTNTGHGFKALPATNSTAFDNGMSSSVWDQLMVFGHDGNHYGFYATNFVYCTWGTVASFGGGGLYLDDNSASTAPALFYGNFRLNHGSFITFVNGSSHAVRLVGRSGPTNTGKINLLHFGYLQAAVWSVTPIAGVTITAPASTQRVFYADSNVQYLAVDFPDFESTISSPAVTLPTIGGVWIGPGGGGSGFTLPRQLASGDPNTPNRSLHSDLSQRLLLAEVAGTKWSLFKDIAGPALTVNTDGAQRIVGVPGCITHRSGPSGDRPVAPPAGTTYFDTTLAKPIWYTGSGWVDGAGTAVAAIGAAASAAADAFTRANSTTTLGNADSGHPWNTADTFGIISNAAYCPTAVSAAATESMAWVVTNLADGIVNVTLTTRLSSLETGLVVRLSDPSNFIRITSANIRKVVAGSAKTSTAFSSNFASGDVMQVVMSGSTITVKKNGSTVATFVDAFNATATAHGLRTFNDNGVSRWNAFSVTAP